MDHLILSNESLDEELGEWVTVCVGDWVSGEVS